MGTHAHSSIHFDTMKRFFLTLSVATILLLGSVIADEPCPVVEQDGKCNYCSTPPDGNNQCPPNNDLTTVGDGSKHIYIYIYDAIMLFTKACVGPCCVPKPPSSDATANANANAQGGGDATANANANAQGGGTAVANASAQSGGQ